MESIYNLVPEPYVEPYKPPMYRSKYDPKAPLTSSTFGLRGTTATVGGGVNEIRKNHTLSSTFGPTSQSITSASNFLKAGSKTRQAPKEASAFARASGKTKPLVPRREDKPVMGLRTSKNFITANAVEAILSVPQMPQSEGVDYVNKEDYGKVPEYLSQVKEEIRRENEMIDEYVRKQLSQDEDAPEEFTEMDEQDRVDLVNKLKTKWDDVNEKYQKICHRTNFESFGDIHFKEGKEAELKKLENDIMMLQRAGSVMVSEDR
ncbi:hypothetical protein TrVE_jg7131 [Triparma verrucosa]|uniref:Enkurin domain-containing protein n=1 Tax=Triparma verrucosa TaxID=1606542 RepID=A0A9W7B522_9STRA|nr:hypothetical protein TrVE_jg7131 [Triparma verrucosa]|mmetsp:Transcript_21682/g.40817  ORF Transcript_21682/g.40817 Transcript_21682/m.40817 type:complete len:262 (+) Transcript_21682:19-804(+)